MYRKVFQTKKNTHTTTNELGDMNTDLCIYVWRVVQLVITMSGRVYVIVGWGMGFLRLLQLTTPFRSL